MSDVIIRPMQTADLPVVGELAAELVQLHHSYDPRRFFLEGDVAAGYRAYFARELGKPEVVLLVASVDGAVAGYVYGSLERRDWARLLDAHGAVHDVHVSGSARRRGVGRALMRGAVEAFRALGAKQVVLSTATQNEEGQALFKALGFRPTMIELTLET